MKKERIDVLLVEQGFFDSREKAKRAIMAGIVHDDYDIIDKPGTKIPIDSNLHVKGNIMPYVSRGGLKLEKALKEFSLDIKDKIMVDIGSSTGGFTDCALQNGAKLVYAVDVGTNQLVWKLRNDPRVIVKEQTNFRYATIDLFQEGIPTLASIDVSFISLKHIFNALKNILKTTDQVVALIKPQFEAGKEDGFTLTNLTYSPITGGEGNIEFLGLFIKDGKDVEINIEDIVNAAHNCFER